MTNHPPPDLSDIWEGAAPAPRRPPSSSRRRGEPNPYRKRPPRRRRISALSYVALVLACLCAAAVAFLLVAAPIDLVRDRVVEQVKARTGRDLIIAGSSAFSFFPRPAVSLSDVSLAAPHGMDSPPTLVVPTVEAELRLWSLLTAQPAVERITLHGPTIELSIDAGGRRSWDAADRGPRSAPSEADNTSTHQSPGGPSQTDHRSLAKALSKFTSGTVRIVDGTVRYSNHASGTHSEIERLNLTVGADDPAGPLNIGGRLTIRGAQLAVAGTVTPVEALWSGQPARIAFKVSGPPFEGRYEGTLSLTDGISADGNLKLQAASARLLGDWLDRPLPANLDGGGLALSTALTATQSRVALSDLQASLGSATMAGSLALEMQQPRPRVTGNLQLSELDFGKLLVKPSRVPTNVADNSSPSAMPPASSPASSQGSAREWSDDPINLSILRLLDAKLTLRAGNLVYKQVKTGPSRLSVALEGGLGQITLEDVELYGGRGRGFLTLDGTGDVLVAGTTFKLDGVDLRPLLVDALQFPWLEGRGWISLDLAGQGLSERQIIAALNGKVDVASANGAIIGLDVGKVMRGLQHGRLPSFSPSPEEKTPFSELTGTFTIANGVARNQNLKLVSTHLHLSGEGTLDLGPRQIDYTVHTKVGGGAPEPDATVKIGTIEVPISIAGPWEKPTFGIKGQEHLTGALKQIRKNLKSQDVRDAIKGLLQGDGDKRVKPRELIDKLLKKD